MYKIKPYYGKASIHNPETNTFYDESGRPYGSKVTISYEVYFKPFWFWPWEEITGGSRLDSIEQCNEIVADHKNARQWSA